MSGDLRPPSHERGAARPPPHGSFMQVVAIGGGTGLSTLLRGLKLYLPGITNPVQAKIFRLTAVVTVTDEGGSSGRLRREMGVLPPGDIRNCMVALAEDEKLLTKLFNYRFSTGHGLRGHSFGNLFLVALTHLTRDFAKAVRVSSEVLAIRGEIFPSTLSDVRLKAEQADGNIIYGESRITKTRNSHQALAHCPQPLPPPAGNAHRSRECRPHHGRSRVTLHLAHPEPAGPWDSRTGRSLQSAKGLYLQSHDSTRRIARLLCRRPFARFARTCRAQAF